MSKENKNLVVGLDIGTSKVVAIVAELLPDNRLNIIGMGGHESKGLKKGVVVNIEATVSAIQRASLPVSPAATSRASIPAAWWRSRTRR
jgi:cell division protein FtsA